MTRFRGAYCMALVVGLSGCPNKGHEDDAKTTTTATTVASTPTPVPSATAAAAPAKLTIVPRVKAELDNRPDGITGAPLAVSGAVASLQTPTGWQATKGDVTVVASADKKAELGATAFGPEGSAGKLAAAAAALGLASCEWGAPETLLVGKTKLAATGGDGVCTRGATQVRTAYVAPQAEKLLVVGEWDSEADSANVFGAMRSIAKAGGGDSSGIAACCAALRQNANVAPPEQKGALLIAAGACDAARNNPDTRAALAAVRAALAGANAPSSCK